MNAAYLDASALVKLFKHEPRPMRYELRSSSGRSVASELTRVGRITYRTSGTRL